MIKDFYDFLRRLRDRYPFLINNSLYRFIKPIYLKIKMAIYPINPKPDENAVSFYTQNAERVKAVTNMLADEKSKRTYLGIIKYRQTGCKKDFPLRDLEATEYFIKELILSEDEVFIDCGAFTGDTIDDFLRYSKKKYKSIIAFEPAVKNFEKLKKYENNPKITLINSGAYDKDGDVYFSGLQGEGCKIISNSNNIISIQVRTIDSLNLEKVTFIKMDIEGAELNALRGGGEKTIKRDKPKLAICIYHSNDDMIRIAEYIHNLVPEYKLYVRHHNFPLFYDTILYAIPSCLNKRQV